MKYEYKLQEYTFKISVKFFRNYTFFGPVGIPRALDFQFKFQCIFRTSLSVTLESKNKNVPYIILALCRLEHTFWPEFKKPGISFQWNQSKSVSQNFVLDD